MFGAQGLERDLLFRIEGEGFIVGELVGVVVARFSSTLGSAP